jgi:hypothetical protein
MRSMNLLFEDSHLKVVTLFKSVLIGCAVGLLPAAPWYKLGGQMGDRIDAWVSIILLPGIIVDYPFGGVHGMNIEVVQVFTCFAYIAAAYWWLRRRERNKRHEV